MKSTSLSIVTSRSPAPPESKTDSANSRLDNLNREKMRHLRCICFVRPSAESVQYLIDEFREPKYGEYFICKTSLVVCRACCMVRRCALEAKHSIKTLVTSSVNPLSSGWQKSTIRKWYAASRNTLLITL